MALILNTTPPIKYMVFVRGVGLHTVFFESLKIPWWYRIFRKPNGKLVALEEMDTGRQKGWKFVASCLVPDELPNEMS